MTANLINVLINRPYYQERSNNARPYPACYRWHRIQCFGQWIPLGQQFTYDEANTQIDTLVFTDNDAHLTITDTSLELLKSKNGTLQNSNARVGGSWTVTGSDGSSFKV